MIALIYDLVEPEFLLLFSEIYGFLLHHISLSMPSSAQAKSPVLERKTYFKGIIRHTFQFASEDSVVCYGEGDTEAFFGLFATGMTQSPRLDSACGCCLLVTLLVTSAGCMFCLLCITRFLKSCPYSLPD